MKTPINSTSDSKSTKRLLRKLLELQIELDKYQSERLYYQAGELRALNIAVDHFLERIIGER